MTPNEIAALLEHHAYIIRDGARTAVNGDTWDRKQVKESALRVVELLQLLDKNDQKTG